MKKTHFSLAEVAAASGISEKDILTFCRREFFKYSEKRPLGDRKHEYFFSEGETIFICVFQRLQRSFKIDYRFSLKWKTKILEAIAGQRKYFTISLTDLGGATQFFYAEADQIPRSTTADVVVAINLQNIYEKIKGIGE